MADNEGRKYRLKPGEKARVWYNRPGAERKRPAKASPEAAVAQEPFSGGDSKPRLITPHIGFYDLATSYGQIDPNVRVGWALIQGTGELLNRNGTRDFINGYLETDSELQFGNFGVPLRDLQTLTYLSAEPFEYSPALTPRPALDAYRRGVPNRWQLWHDCGALFLDFNIYQEPRGGRVERRYVLQNGTKEWQKIRHINERAERYHAIAATAYDNTPESNIVKNRVENIIQAEQEELWLNYQSAMTYQQEGRLIPRIVPGAYDWRLDSPYYYEPIDTNDRAQYKVTRISHYQAEEVDLPRIMAGSKTAPEYRIFLVPQMWRVQCRFIAWYIFFTYWAFTYVAIPFTFVFWNRFPLFPRPFALGTAPTDPFGYVPVWQWVERSKAHSRVVSQTLALQFFSPFMTMVFVFTSDGFFEIFRTNSFEGTLAGVVERGRERFYIWRRTGTDRDLSQQIGAGKLQTYFINSFGANLIGGIPGIEGGGGIPA